MSAREQERIDSGREVGANLLSAAADTPTINPLNLHHQNLPSVQRAASLKAMLRSQCGLCDACFGRQRAHLRLDLDLALPRSATSPPRTRLDQNRYWI